MPPKENDSRGSNFWIQTGRPWIASNNFPHFDKFTKQVDV